jgi:FixJ family two-component response regulator
MISHAIHVAILDDDPSVRIALARLLKAAGMTADTYATSDELFEAVASKRPDCLLLDFQMPVMDGLAVLNCLSERHIRIPTIVITGSDEAVYKSACLNAGAIGHLKKPVNAAQLIQMINGIVEASHSGATASSG